MPSAPGQLNCEGGPKISGYFQFEGRGFELSLEIPDHFPQFDAKIASVTFNNPGDMEGKHKCSLKYKSDQLDLVMDNGLKVEGQVSILGLPYTTIEECQATFTNADD